MLPPGPRQTVVLERRKKKNYFLEESVLIVLLRGRGGSCQGWNESSVWGVPPFSQPQEKPRTPHP